MNGPNRFRNRMSPVRARVDVSTHAHGSGGPICGAGSPAGWAVTMPSPRGHAFKG